jgi:hypothetical protein
MDRLKKKPFTILLSIFVILISTSIITSNQAEIVDDRIYNLNNEIKSSAPIGWISDYLVDNFTVLGNENRTYSGFLGKTISIRYRIINKGDFDPKGILRIADNNWTDKMGGLNTFYTEQKFGIDTTLPKGSEKDLSYIIFEKEDWSSNNVSFNVEMIGAQEFRIEVYNITTKYHVPRPDYNPTLCIDAQTIDLLFLLPDGNVKKKYSNINFYSDIVITLITNETFTPPAIGILKIADNDTQNPDRNYFYSETSFNHSSPILDKFYVTFAYPNWQNSSLEVDITNQNNFDPIYIKIEMTKGCKPSNNGRGPGSFPIPGYNISILLVVSLGITLVILKKYFRKDYSERTK